MTETSVKATYKGAASLKTGHYTSEPRSLGGE